MKTILVTGGNSGIGYQTVYQLLMQGHRVIFTSRNVIKGKEVQKKLNRLTTSERAILKQLDLADFTSVRRLAKEIKAEFEHLDVIVNNAGIYTDTFALTKDGFEKQIGVNHLGHFLLNNLLLDMLQKSPSPRVVTVASKVHTSARQLDFERFTNDKGKYKGMLAYANAKLANVLFSFELARRYPNIASNALHPGVVNTDIGNKNANWMVSAGWHLMRLFAISPAKGAETSVYCAVSPEMEGITGKYMDECRQKEPAKLAHDLEMARELWERSLKFCGL